LVATLRKCRYFAAAVDPCGGKFRAQGRKSTCSAKCKLRDEQDRLAERDFSPKKPRMCELCKARPVYYRSAMTCLECRDEYAKMMRSTQAVNRYWAHPEAARAKENAKKKAALAKDPAKVRAKKNAAYHRSVAKNPEKISAQQHTRYRRWYSKDPKRARAMGLANYYKHADKINARLRAEYASDVELARAKQRAKQASRKARHPRRVKALSKAREQRRRDMIRRERGW
jgi:hypothetical protein